MIKASVDISVTPRMLAEMLWDMGSIQQADFFRELAKVIEEDHKTNSSAYSMGELQWHHLESELQQPSNKLARDMLMTMAAPCYFHTLCAATGAAQ